MYSSGVNRQILAMVPAEESKYVTLGSSVILTAAIATMSSTAAARLLDEGSIGWRKEYAAVGLAVGILVYTVDRLLVKFPLNPYRFPSEVVAALWNPSADAQWWSVVGKKLQEPSATRRVTQFFGTLASVIVRVVVAFCFSFVVSELAVMWIFQSEVDDRVEVLREQRSADRVAQVQATYEEQVGRLDDRIEALREVRSSPEVVAATQLVESIQQQADDIRRDLAVIEAAKNAEAQGRAEEFVLTDGTKFATSGESGVGPLTRQLASLEATRNADLLVTEDAKARAEGELQSAQADADERASENDVELNSLLAERAALTDAQDGLKAEAAQEGSVVSGLLLRREALEQLASDPDPSTAELEDRAVCVDGGFFCDLRERIYKSTPMGPWIGAFRWFFLTIDMLPILLKMQLSLRQRRPYDALVAALEERGTANALDLADDGLSHVGRDLEARAYWRKSQRAGSGMEYLLNVERSRRERRRIRDYARAIRRNFGGRGQTEDPLAEVRRVLAAERAAEVAQEEEARGYWEGEPQRTSRPREPQFYDQDDPESGLSATDRSPTDDQVPDHRRSNIDPSGSSR